MWLEGGGASTDLCFLHDRQGKGQQAAPPPLLEGVLQSAEWCTPKAPTPDPQNAHHLEMRI